MATTTLDRSKAPTGNKGTVVMRLRNRERLSRIAPSLRLDNKNEFQPDCLLRIETSKLGRSWVSAALSMRPLSGSSPLREDKRQ
jgi:hypothetical protein